VLITLCLDAATEVGSTPFPWCPAGQDGQQTFYAVAGRQLRPPQSRRSDSPAVMKAASMSSRPSVKWAQLS